MWPFSLTLIYCALIVAASLAGGWLPSVVRLTHTRMQFMLSFVGGLMLGVGLLHLLPHGIVTSGDLDLTIRWAMIGLLVMFFLIRTFQFHQHGPATGGADQEPGRHRDVGEDQRAEQPEPGPGQRGTHRLSWVGVAFGLSLHSLIDGIALGAAVVADAGHATGVPLYGVATFLAVLLHKPLDALSITSLMRAGGWAARSRQLVNAGFALTCPVGAVLVWVGMQQLTGQQHTLIGCLLGFSAGVFLCISLGDLLPEVQFHAHDRVTLSAALLAGVALAYAIGFIEPAHSHAGDHHEKPSTLISSETMPHIKVVADTTPLPCSRLALEQLTVAR
jgi:zinc and cadmium transporter